MKKVFEELKKRYIKNWKKKIGKVKRIRRRCLEFKMLKQYYTSNLISCSEKYIREKRPKKEKTKLSWRKWKDYMSNWKKKRKRLKQKQWPEDEMVKEARILFWLEIDYYEPIETESVSDRNFIKHPFNGDKDKTSSLCKYLEVIRSYLKNLKGSLKESDE